MAGDRSHVISQGRWPGHELASWIEDPQAQIMEPEFHHPPIVSLLPIYFSGLYASAQLPAFSPTM